jgi:hypothetical protein
MALLSPNMPLLSGLPERQPQHPMSVRWPDEPWVYCSRVRVARQVERAERLPAIEDELVDAGFDKFIVATDAGTSTGRNVALMPRQAGEEPPGMATFDLDPRDRCVCPRCGSGRTEIRITTSCSASGSFHSNPSWSIK